MPSYITFFIDPDDEIPALVDRMKSTDAGFIVFVVPMRALLFASIVTMRLFRKEADRLDKDIIIVTQDEQGFDISKRVGFITRRSVEELPFITAPSAKAPEEGRVPVSDTSPSLIMGSKTRSKPFEAFPVGQAPSLGNGLTTREKDLSESYRNQQSKEIATSQASPVRVRKDLLYEGATHDRRHIEGEGIGSPIWNEEGKHFKKESMSQRLSGTGEVNLSGKEHEVKSSNTPEKKQTTSPKDSKVSLGSREEGSVGSHVQWIVAISFLAVLIMVGGIGIYMQAPETHLIVHQKRESVSGDVTYGAHLGNENSVNIQFSQYEDEITQTSPATGVASGSGRKARGSVTIYNNYSTESQPLVATTRLETSEGKLFRMTQSAVVPGMHEKDGVMQPGEVTVEVQADEPGAEYNIDATKFSIPGFSSSPKKEKIYAESAEAMSGGGSGEDESRDVSQADILRAKKEIEMEVRNRVAERVKTEIASGITLDELVEIHFLDEQAIPSLGTVTDTFNLKAKVLVKYVAFSEDDIKKEAVRQLQGGGVSEESIGDLNMEDLYVEYGKMIVDFDKQMVDMKMFVSGEISYDIPVDQIKQSIAGKRKEELEDAFEFYPQVNGFEIEIEQSGFRNSVSKDLSKIHIEVQ